MKKRLILCLESVIAVLLLLCTMAAAQAEDPQPSKSAEQWKKEGYIVNAFHSVVLYHVRLLAAVLHRHAHPLSVPFPVLAYHPYNDVLRVFVFIHCIAFLLFCQFRRILCGIITLCRVGYRQRYSLPSVFVVAHKRTDKLF